MSGDVGTRTRALFTVVSTEAMLRLRENGRRRLFPRGCVLMRQGERADAMYQITDGVVDVVVTDPETDERTHVALLGRGEVVGEIGVLSGRPRSATVIAVNDVAAIELSRDDVLTTLLELPGLPGPLRTLLEKRLTPSAATVDPTMEYELVRAH